jgi:hypothetical protein
MLTWTVSSWTRPPGSSATRSRSKRWAKRRRGASSVEELSRYLIGWRGYFGFCETPSVLRALDQWIRRRLRSIVWKQWKRGRTRFAELRRRGVAYDLAAQTAGSAHGPWRISNSPALAIALSNDELDFRPLGQCENSALLGATAQRGDGLNHATRDEPGDDAPDSGVGDVEALQADKAGRSWRGPTWESRGAGRTVRAGVSAHVLLWPARLRR